MIKVKTFGLLSEILGFKETEMSASETRELITTLESRAHRLKEIDYVIAVNHAVQLKHVKLKSGDEVALMPPFAGG